jgi:hypothetical protein
VTAGSLYVGGAAERNSIIGVEFNQQHAECTGALRTRLPNPVERVCGDR